MRSDVRVMFVLLVTMFGVARASDAPAFVPASFARDNEFAGKLQCPVDIAGRDDVTVKCQASVASDGAIRTAQSFCFAADARDAILAGTVQSALSTLRLRPASVSGIATAVYIGFRVIANGTPADCHVKLIANLGPTSEIADENYSAPQKILSERAQEQRTMFGMPMHARGKGVAEKDLVMVSATVSADGTLRDVRVDFDAHPMGNVADGGARQLEREKFIPGSVDGNAQTMRYHEVHFSAMRQVSLRPSPGVR